MATMIPPNVKHFTTEGEKRFYRFLESVAKPDSKYIAWYTPDIEGKEPLPFMIEKVLESNGILSNWISENYRSKKTYDITTNSVTISTIHSLKGLDYSHVFLLGLDFLEPKGWTEEQINNLVYVAITRAGYQLFIPYISKNALIKKLLEYA